ncbi:phosphatidyl inositol kinase [Orbilia oligospora]|uniref:Phosphatidylinositol 4-kinase n=1 Tax=Orbilia oligospora TaxID=2813651 RepID=A0A7C8JEE5_ORBOL|nr:phosphatidyl inositol kinase [Orbilia oligospora]KAF3106430.1 phosphatidyl inositol kinase [Orbilia oligospora]KAF3111224.1 phosphatidyl inositol kinase [Orbilia oligospora]KAF3126398.1 phosphatidyl inositol kinase [Orbilia oligospora]KAF3147025.1 phosphatidyl inositol kinase [Orbilia oligospora]
MPRPAKSGYARIAQDEWLNDSDSEEDIEAYRDGLSRTKRTVSIQPEPTAIYRTPSNPLPGRPPGRPRRDSSGVDIKAINNRLEKWAEEIASKFKRKSKKQPRGEKRLEIYYSVFVPPEGMKALTPEYTGYQEPTFSRGQFEDAVDSVRYAIGRGIHPKLISQGSSGSYFVTNSRGKTVAVFKPKDEEPYGNLNPKWTKWLHRNLFPCFFGRSCLIPNLSYVSEAAASYLDRQLRTFIVPYTDLVWLSSKSFHYDFWDRRAFYRKGKPLPEKVGSFQVFLNGYKDATTFLKEHPWPDRYNSSFQQEGSKRRRTGWTSSCRTSRDDDYADEEAGFEESEGLSDETENRGRFFWTDTLRQAFREELEKLILLDYLMRNTDRGADNWMVRIDREAQSVQIVSSSPMRLPVDPGDIGGSLDDEGGHLKAPSPGYKAHKPMSINSRSGTPLSAGVEKVNIGAIDNSLAFPWKHPDQWRSFPYGWLFLPVSLVGQPFSQKTRDHFLPLLTSTKWWAETQMGLKEIFKQDADFKERMWAKQLAVLKGQAFNIVETLKMADSGPLELTRRTRVHVWDDEMDIPVAVPLTVPSSEARLRNQAEIMNGEVDIGTGTASAPVPYRNMNALGSPTSELPRAQRFGLNSGFNGKFSEEAEDLESALISPTSDVGIQDQQRPQKKKKGKSVDEGRVSFDGRSQNSWSKALGMKGGGGVRRGLSSVSTAGSSRRASVFGAYDEEEGDLGFSAAEGLESSHRKVIVERLEAVKSKPPVFTWC